MIWIGASIVLLLVVLGIFAALMQIAEFPELAPMVRTLDLQQAEHQHHEALNSAARRFETRPRMSMGRREFEYYLALAILTKDRIHQLNGLPNGPNVRKKWRRELVSQIKQLALEHNYERPS